jgi:plastocyanin
VKGTGVTMKPWLGMALAAAAFLAPPQVLAGDVVKVKIEGLAFGPAQLSVHVGDTVEWENADFVAHTATELHGAFDVMIPAGATRRLLLKQAGTFEYYCRFHPTMKGELRVK